MHAKSLYTECNVVLTKFLVIKSKVHNHEPQQWFIVGTSKIVGMHHEENPP